MSIIEEKTNHSNKKLLESIKKCIKKQFLNDKQPVNRKGNLVSIIKSQIDNDYVHYFPYSVLWEVISQCNLRCKHCFYYSNQERFERKNDLSTEEILKHAEFFIDEINILHFILTGGEPFLQKDIFQIIKYLKTRNVSLEVKSNGTLITESIAEELKNLLSQKTDSIHISLDGATQQTHDKIRGEGSFQRAITGIKNLLENDINVVISFTINSINVDDLAELYRLCKGLKVKQIMFGRIQVCSEAQEYLYPEPEKVFISVADLIDEVNDDNSIYINWNIFKIYDYLNCEPARSLLDKYLQHEEITPSQYMRCYNQDSMGIWGNGDISMCHEVQKQGFCFGNLREKSFYEIWENKHNNIFLKERKLEKSVCKNCKYISYCGAGCPAIAYSQYGDINAPGGRCMYGKKLFEQSKKG